MLINVGIYFKCRYIFIIIMVTLTKNIKISQIMYICDMRTHRNYDKANLIYFNVFQALIC